MYQSIQGGFIPCVGDALAASNALDPASVVEPVLLTRDVYPYVILLCFRFGTALRM